MERGKESKKPKKRKFFTKFAYPYCERGSVSCTGER